MTPTNHRFSAGHRSLRLDILQGLSLEHFGVGFEKKGGIEAMEFTKKSPYILQYVYIYMYIYVYIYIIIYMY